MSRILIVDDTVNLMRKWKRALNKENIDVTEVVNSHQLFAELLEGEVDLIIIELFLGTEHGYYIIKRLKENPIYKNIPIMVASSERRRASIQEVIDVGIDDYLIKPVDTDLLVKRVKRILKRSSATLASSRAS